MDYKELARLWKAKIKSYNTNINTNYTGTLIDIFANATGDTIAGVYTYINAINTGSQLEKANDFMLESWADSLNISRKKTGTYSFGSLEVEFNGDELVIPLDTDFLLGEYAFRTVIEQTITQLEPTVDVRSPLIGSEYNIREGVELASSLSGIIKATSLGITGGTGIETRSQFRNRILANINPRRTSSQESDFVQYALEHLNYVESDLKFMEEPYDFMVSGIELTVCNTINDFERASKSLELIDITASNNQLETLRNELSVLRVMDTYFYLKTRNIQEVGGLELMYTTSKTLTTEEIKFIKQKFRQYLLEFQGDYLYPRSIKDLDILNLVDTYYIVEFEPIEKTSLYMDSLQLKVTEYAL